jgi:hypothetical protein
MWRVSLVLLLLGSLYFSVSTWKAAPTIVQSGTVHATDGGVDPPPPPKP